jgi:carbamate kinase
MKPKVEAVAEFVAATPGASGVIGAPDEIAEILAGRSGARITADEGTR